MIYIDPPYNTGNDFIYPDDYSESLQTYLEYTGQVDAEGKKFSTNTETDGRFHSKWLNMMYPRLYLARNLLREDGVIFISIDDNEVANLRRLCDEIFGEENFIGIFVINSSPSAIDYGHIAKMHDYALCFSKTYQKSPPVSYQRKIRSLDMKMKRVRLIFIRFIMAMLHSTPRLGRICFIRFI
jgi:adenine-specific DNA-methyltransferase